MSMFKQDASGDIVIENNKFVLIDGKTEIAQRLRQNLLTLFGEWFLDGTIGLPWLQEIFEKNTPARQIDDLIKKEVLGTRGVTGFKSYTPIDLNTATRRMTLTFSVLTTEGVLDVTDMEVSP